MSIFDKPDITILQALRADVETNWRACGGDLMNVEASWEACCLGMSPKGRIDGFAFNWLKENHLSERVADPIPSIYKFGKITNAFNCYLNAEDTDILPRSCRDMDLILEGDKLGKAQVFLSTLGVRGDIDNMDNFEIWLNAKSHRLLGPPAPGEVSIFLDTKMDLEAHLRMDLNITVAYAGSHISMRCAKPSHEELYQIYKDIRGCRDMSYFKNAIPQNWPWLSQIWLTFEIDGQTSGICIERDNFEINLDAWGPALY